MKYVVVVKLYDKKRTFILENVQRVKSFVVIIDRRPFLCMHEALHKYSPALFIEESGSGIWQQWQQCAAFLSSVFHFS